MFTPAGPSAVPTGGAGVAAPAAICKKLGIEKGSDKPQNKVAKLTKQQLEELAQEKMEDLNTLDLAQAKKIIAGTARSMGIDADI